MCYVHFINGINVIEEELLFCKSIFEGTMTKDLFETTNKFMNHNNTKWENDLSVCTIGARAITGNYGGLQALIRQKAPEMIWTYCFIHRVFGITKNESIFKQRT